MFCYGTGNGRTEVLNVNGSWHFLFICLMKTVFSNLSKAVKEKHLNLVAFGFGEDQTVVPVDS